GHGGGVGDGGLFNLLLEAVLVDAELLGGEVGNELAVVLELDGDGDLHLRHGDGVLELRLLLLRGRRRGRGGRGGRGGWLLGDDDRALLLLLGRTLSDRGGRERGQEEEEEGKTETTELHEESGIGGEVFLMLIQTGEGSRGLRS